MNKHKKTKDTAHLRGVAVILTMLLFLTGCTESNNPFSPEKSEPTVTVDDLNISVKYAESYDETSMYFSRRWPKSMSHGFAKTMNEDGEIMTDYERTSKTIAYDEEGYLYTITEFLEGDSEMNMPESIHEAIKHHKPGEDINKDPVVREEFSKGESYLYGKSGKVISQHSFNPEDFRLDQESLEILASYVENSSSNDQNVSNRIDNLNSSGLSYQIKNSFYADVEETVSDQTTSKISKLKYRLDLRTGMKVEEIAYDLQNRPIHYRISSYANIEGTPMLQRELFYEYGELNNNWEIIGRNVITRTNHNIIRN
jgi:hypothetical protein